jgi:hypothetical protein
MGILDEAKQRYQKEQAENTRKATRLGQIQRAYADLEEQEIQARQTWGADGHRTQT